MDPKLLLSDFFFIFSPYLYCSGKQTCVVCKAKSNGFFFSILEPIKEDLFYSVRVQL